MYRIVVTHYYTGDSIVTQYCIGYIVVTHYYTGDTEVTHYYTEDHNVTQIKVFFRFDKNVWYHSIKTDSCLKEKSFSQVFLEQKSLIPKYVTNYFSVAGFEEPNIDHKSVGRNGEVTAVHLFMKYVHTAAECQDLKNQHV